MYTIFENMIGGVDRTRPIYAMAPGTLWVGKNGHLTSGGDFEQRKAFVDLGALSAVTFGLEHDGHMLYTFGSAPAPALPSGVGYQRLQHPDGFAMTGLVSTEVFAGKIFAIATFADGSTIEFYDAAVVSDWVSGVVRAAMLNNDGIAAHLSGLMAADTTYTATVVGNVITIEHNTENTAFALACETENVEGGVDDQNGAVVTTVPASGGVKEKKTVTIGGTFEVGDRFTLVFTDATPDLKYGAKFNPTGTTTVAKTFGRKVYVAAGSLLEFSGVDTATGWNREDDAGAGFIDVSVHDGSAHTITALGKYLNYLAVASPESLQIWALFADDAENEPVQFIGDTGTRSPRAMRNYGDLDLFYLSESGIRSLRARQVVNVAGVQDVGTPIDPLVQTQVADPAVDVTQACSITDPLTGRFWMAVGDKVFVFSYYPSKKISGWSWYEPGFTVTHMVVKDGRVYCRSSAGQLYVYGGADGVTYDACQVTMQQPYFSGAKPGTFKQLVGVDIAALGTWHIDVLVDPRDETQRVVVGEVDGVTFGQEDIAAMGETPYMAVKATRETMGPASISMLGLFYVPGRSES